MSVKDRSQEAVGTAATAAGGAYGTKKLTGQYALKKITDNPARLDKIVNSYQSSRSGRRPLNARGVYNSKFHHDPVKRKLNHAITHWEDAGGVKFHRKITEKNPSPLTKLHPRYEEHQVLRRAIQRSGPTGTPLYRGVTMDPQGVKSLRKGQVVSRKTESWSDSEEKAKKFAQNRLARDKKATGHVPVTYRMGGKNKALNIQSQSNWNMSEWVSDQPYRVKKIKKRPDGSIDVKVKQVPKGAEVKRAAALARKAILANSIVHKMSPRAAANVVGAHAGAHWTTQLTRGSDRIEPYLARHAYAGKRRKPSTLLDKGGKVLVKARTKASEVVRVASYDVSNLNDKDKFVREVATGQGIIRKSSDFLEMPNGVTEDSVDQSRVRAEDLTGIRLRDVKTGKFVAAPTLVAKKLSPTTFKGLFEGIAAGSIGGIVANQFPQNRRDSKKSLKKLDPKLSVTLQKKPE